MSCKNSSLDSASSLETLQRAARIGLWRAYIDDKVFVVSSFVMELLGVESERISFTDFAHKLQENFRNEFLDNISNVDTDHILHSDLLLIQTPKGSEQVILKASGKGFDENGRPFKEGYIQCVDNGKALVENRVQCGDKGENCPYGLSVKEKNETMGYVRRLLNWQKYITEALYGLLDGSEEKRESVAGSMLDMIRTHFKSERASIFAFGPRKRRITCVYESVTGWNTPRKNELYRVLIDPHDEMVAAMLAKVPVFTNDMEQLPELVVNTDGRPASTPYMATPIYSREGVWGFVIVEAPRGKSGWSDSDKENFAAVTNVVGVSLALKNSEDAAIKHKEFVNLLLQNMPMGYFWLRIITDQHGNVTDYIYSDVNTKFLEMVGRRRDEIVGRSLSEVGPIFVDKLDIQVLYGVAFEGKVYETTGQFRSNGRYCNTLIYSPVRGDVVALFSDTTDAVIASQVLAESERSLKRIYDNLPVGIEVYDKDGFMIEVNDRELAIQGVTDRNVLLGLNLFEHPSLPKFAHDLLKEGKDVTFDVDVDYMKVNRQYYGLGESEQIKYLTINSTVIYNTAGELDGYLLIIVDNTEIYKTTSQLKEFESAFSSTAEIAEVGLFRWDLLRGASFSTLQWYKNMGIDPEKQRDRSLSFDDYKNIIHPDDRGKLERFLKNAVKGKAKSIKHEFRVRDGRKWKWLRTAARVTEYDPSRDVVQVVGVNYNINELKNTEQRLLEAKFKAEASDKLKSAFLANMSHEIRTPLNAIVGFSHILIESTDDDDRQEYISIIQQNSDQLLKLISDILDLSKIESGVIDVFMEEVNVDSLCNQIVTSVSPKAENGVEVKFLHSSGTHDTVIRSDSKLLNQVLSNFLTNALKFTTQGHVWTDYKIEGDEITMWVEDTGSGIAKKQLSTVFTRFVKLNEFVPGTGLGLPICKSIIEKLGGTIGVESELGVGSKFWFKIPL